jgi:hypothetical protein
MNTDGFEDQEWVRQGVALALAREYERDARSFLGLFAENLERTFPDSTSVERKGIFKKAVFRVTLDLGGTRLTIEDPGKGPLLGKRGQVVRGITLKTEETPVAEILEQIGHELQARASRNAKTQAALGQWLGMQ